MPSGPSPPCPCVACMLSALTACSQPYSKGLLTEIHGVGSSWGEQATEHVFHLYYSMQGSRCHGMTLDWILGQISSVLRPQNVPSLLSPQFESDFALTKSSSQSLVQDVTGWCVEGSWNGNRLNIHQGTFEELVFPDNYGQ
ncbi:hypothetical protein F5141DRAFT_1067740 [Pisolithus sp. B1]|nr:hypothetical protein F5141DRAFT_1067740 [Pisolithus sp. B1]